MSTSPGRAFSAVLGGICLALSLLMLYGGVQADPWSIGSRLEAENELGILATVFAIPSMVVSLFIIGLGGVVAHQNGNIMRIGEYWAVRLAICAVGVNIVAFGIFAIRAST